MSQSSQTIIAPVGLDVPVTDSNGDFIVLPTDNSLHANFNFFMWVTATGGAGFWFGPYSLSIGCTDVSNRLANSNLDTYMSVRVGSSVSNRYTMYGPSVWRSWCTLESHEIVDTNGSPYTGNDIV